MKHVTWIACLVLMTLGVCPGAATLHGVSGELHLRITSPLGRTGTVGVVRIVAQIESGDGRDGGTGAVLCRRQAAANDRLGSTLRGRVAGR